MKVFASKFFCFNHKSLSCGKFYIGIGFVILLTYLLRTMLAKAGERVPLACKCFRRTVFET